MMMTCILVPEFCVIFDLLVTVVEFWEYLVVKCLLLVCLLERENP
jgi:hypothetical protein